MKTSQDLVRFAGSLLGLLLATGTISPAFSQDAAPAIPAPPAPPALPAFPSPERVSSSTGATLELAPTCLTDLHVVEGDTAKVLQGNGNLTAAGDKTLKLALSDLSCSTEASSTIQVPAGTNIHLRGNKTDITVTGPSGHLSGLSGSGDVRVNSATGVDLRMTGSGNVSIATVTGDVHVLNFSSGDLLVGLVTAPRVELSATSSGNMLLRSGSVENLSIRDLGSSDITAHVSAISASLSLYGSGNVLVDSVSGTLSRSHYGSGDLTVHTTGPGVHVTAAAPINGQAITKDILASLGQSVNFDSGTQQGWEALGSFGKHSSGHHLGGLRLVLIVVCVWLVLRHARRYRKRTGESFFAALWADIAEGLSAFTRNWQTRMADRRMGGQSSAGDAPHVYYTRRAVDLYEEVIHTAKDQSARHKQRHAPETTSFSSNHTLVRLNDRLARMEPRLARMEQFVTSPDFTLERQFRDLERSA